ncbi:MAG: 50S ribosomal protein L9 [Candidatus Omnitrophica bacterium]|nr:50S ribosomal protein L9 [Candidatus Omnitrophota bacterium]
MKVILAQDSPSVGKIGDVITVKDGYARNFLIPKGIAMEFLPANLKAAEAKKTKAALNTKKRKEDADVLAQKLADASWTIPVKIIEEDRIFGSVTVETIQKAFEAEGITIDKKDIQLEEPIKKLGIYQVPVRLHPEVVVSCKIWVVKE